VIAVREHARIALDAVSEIELRVHPLVLSITNVVEPSSGLQSKFSFRHSAAVALADGAAGIAQYADARAADPTVAALRRKVQAVGDETLRKDEAHAVVVAGGARHEAHIAHASGTTDNPMSDAAIEAKFLANATPAIGEERARQASERVWSLEKCADARELIALVA
jgi:2-methylcitrate dehydratase PrpD